MPSLIGNKPNQVPTNGDLGSMAFREANQFYDLGQTVGFRNRLINGDMRIDQRAAGASYSVTTSSAYGSVDRWGALAAATSVWTLQQVATGLTDFPSALRIKRASGSTSTAAVFVGQVIESANCRDLAGNMASLSFYATAGANFSAANARLNVEVWTGSGSDQGLNSLNTSAWTTQAAPLSTSVVVTTARQLFTLQVFIPSGTNEVAVRFNWAGVGTAGANDHVDITGVQLEKGTQATPFESRPYGTELALCQRYYERGTAGLAFSYTPSAFGNGKWLEITVNFNVNKRANPTIGINNVIQNTNFSPGVLNVNTAIYTDHMNTQSFALSAGGTASPPSSGTYWYGTIPWTASIEL